jgi:hypothetical protein
MYKDTKDGQKIRYKDNKRYKRHKDTKIKRYKDADTKIQRYKDVQRC